MKLDFVFKKEKKFDAVGLGLTAIDHLIVLPHFPAPNTKMRLDEYQVQGGGQIGTGFTALARLGLKVKFLGKVGGDHWGDLSLQLLRDEGVDVSHVVREPGATNQFAFILVDKSTGHRTIMWHRHPDLYFREGDFPREAVTAGRLLHLDGHEAAYSIQAAKWARQEKIPILLDAERLKEGTLDLLPLADIIIADENFASLLCPGSTPDDFLKHLSRTYSPRFCAITLGEKGSVGLFDKQLIRVPAYPVDVVDTTGAGDMYHAAFVYGTLKNWDIPDIMKFSSAVAALKCLHLGGRKGAPSIEEVKRFMGEDFPGEP